MKCKVLVLALTLALTACGGGGSGDSTSSGSDAGNTNTGDTGTGTGNTGDTGTVVTESYGAVGSSKDYFRQPIERVTSSLDDGKFELFTNQDPNYLTVYSSYNDEYKNDFRVYKYNEVAVYNAWNREVGLDSDIQYYSVAKAFNEQYEPAVKMFGYEDVASFKYDLSEFETGAYYGFLHFIEQDFIISEQTGLAPRLLSDKQMKDIKAHSLEIAEKMWGDRASEMNENDWKYGISDAMYLFVHQLPLTELDELKSKTYDLIQDDALKNEFLNNCGKYLEGMDACGENELAENKHMLKRFVQQRENGVFLNVAFDPRQLPDGVTAKQSSNQVVVFDVFGDIYGNALTKDIVRHEIIHHIQYNMLNGVNDAYNKMPVFFKEGTAVYLADQMKRSIRNNYKENPLENLTYNDMSLYNEYALVISYLTAGKTQEEREFKFQRFLNLHTIIRDMINTQMGEDIGFNMIADFIKCFNKAGFTDLEGNALTFERLRDDWDLLMADYASKPEYKGLHE